LPMSNESGGSWPPIEHLEIKRMLAGAHQMSTPELITLLQADQRSRWQAGDRVPVEVYLHYLPAVRDDVDAVLRLLFWEAALVEERGAPPSAEELVRRFPHLEGPIRQQHSREQARRESVKSHDAGTIDHQMTEIPVDAQRTLSAAQAETRALAQR